MANDIEVVRRAWEGYETPLEWGRYPVEHEPIRRHCHMVDDTNPRYLEEGHCPPVLVDFFASPGPWPREEHEILALVRKIPTPGRRLINLNHELEWFLPVRVGDRLGMRHRVLSIEQRATRLDPLSVWIRTESIIENDRGEIVARRLNQILVHRAPDEIGAAGGA